MRILLVDDNAQMRELFHTILSSAGHEVATANDGVAAVFTFRTMDDGYFDFVLSDYQMPRMNGIQLLTEIKKLNPRQRFALISADPPSRRTLPQELKDLVILEKPVRTADLLAAITPPAVAETKKADDDPIITAPIL
jgi:CheY-like chemotaxis protein